MAINVSLTSPGVIFFVVLIVIVAAIIFLTSFERKLKRKITGRMSGKNFFDDKLKALRKKEGEPQEFLIELDALARDFFSIKFGVDRESKYSELISFFRERKNTGAAEFCERIQEEFYAGENLSKDSLNFLFENLEFLIMEEKKLGNKKEVAREQTVRAEEEKEVDDKEKERVEKKGVDKGIVKYLSEGSQRGFSLNLLRKKLVENGFSEHEINKAIEHLNLHLEEKPKEVPEVLDIPVIARKRNVKIKTYDREPKSHKRIGSLDDFTRIKAKLKERGRLGSDGLD